MEAEVEAKVGAALGERTEDRTTHRNGYHDRSLQTRIGTPQQAGFLVCRTGLGADNVSCLLQFHASDINVLAPRFHAVTGATSRPLPRHP